MKSYRKELWFETRQRRELINITPKVNECLRESGIKEGLLLCNAMHITSSIFINDDEPGCMRILKPGWKSWRLRSPIHSTGITALRTMRMPISKGP